MVTTFSLSCKGIDVLEDGKAVVVRDFRLGVRMPLLVPRDNVSYYNTGLNTALTVQQGQKLVVGKLSSDRSKGSIFVTITAGIQ